LRRTSEELARQRLEAHHGRAAVKRLRVLAHLRQQRLSVAGETSARVAACASESPARERVFAVVLDIMDSVPRAGPGTAFGSRYRRASRSLRRTHRRRRRAGEYTAAVGG